MLWYAQVVALVLVLVFALTLAREQELLTSGALQIQVFSPTGVRICVLPHSQSIVKVSLNGQIDDTDSQKIFAKDVDASRSADHQYWTYEDESLALTKGSVLRFEITAEDSDGSSQNVQGKHFVKRLMYGKMAERSCADDTPLLARQKRHMFFFDHQHHPFQHQRSSGSPNHHASCHHSSPWDYHPTGGHWGHGSWMHHVVPTTWMPFTPTGPNDVFVTSPGIHGTDMDVDEDEHPDNNGPYPPPTSDPVQPIEPDLGGSEDNGNREELTTRRIIDVDKSSSQPPIKKEVDVTTTATTTIKEPPMIDIRIEEADDNSRNGSSATAIAP